MIIWPAKGADANNTENEILQYFDNQGPPLTNYTSQLDGLVLWYTNITNKQACDIAGLAVDSVQVDGVDPNFELDAPASAPTPVIEERAPALATQTQPVTELRVMSQPTTVPDITRVQNYVFEDDPGSGTYIYMVENGINTSPIDLTGRVDPNPIVAPRAQPGLQDNSPNGHSTCAASKAGGARFGVAKLATIIAVKTSQTISDTAVVFDLVRQDIISRRVQKKAVVNISWGSIPPRSGVIPQYWLTASDFMKSIMKDLDVPIITSSGNDAVRRSQQIDKYPKIFYDATDFPIIVVGSVNFNGVASSFSQSGPQLAVSSPGEGITCSALNGTGSRVAQGTSFAAPQVAGLVSYFLGLDTVPFDTSDGHVAVNALNFVKNTASWVRQTASGSPNVAWNLINEQQNPPS